MKITIVQGAFLPVPALMGGAVEKVWHALGQEFAHRGHAVTHISRYHRELPRRENIDGVENIRIAGFDAPRSLVYLKTLDLFYSLRVLKSLPQADILVTNTFWLPILLRNAKRGRIYVHVARYPKGQMRFYSHVARLQTVSQSVADAICREAPTIREKVRVIPYPLIEVSSQTLSPSPVFPREKRILFVGRIHPEKGLHLLIRAFASLSRETFSEWRLVIVGPAATKFGGGGEDYLEELKGMAQPISDRVEWVGAVFDSTKLEALYRSASLFVYPSLAERGETFGLAPLEAMAGGCVPIVSALPCFHDYVVNRVNGVIFDHAAASPCEHLARELAALAAQPELIRSLSSSAVEKSRDFEIQRIANLYLDDFQSLIASTSR